YRGGPGLADDVTDLVKVMLQISAIFSLGIFHPQRNTHGRGYANRRRAPHHHVADHVGHLVISLAGNVGLFGRQLGLVNEAYAGVGPFESLNHRGSRRSSVFSLQSSVFSNHAVSSLTND